MNICKDGEKKQMKLRYGHIYKHTCGALYIYAEVGGFVNLETGATWPPLQADDVRKLIDVTDKYCLKEI